MELEKIVPVRWMMKMKMRIVERKTTIFDKRTETGQVVAPRRAR
jgi:hypothetical protein